jgi:N-acetylglucosaminyldiphosphoundecaprenol N-acetyl-beta-D-mannosaminyltransferase
MSSPAADFAVVIEGVTINLPTLQAATDAALARAKAGRGFALFTLNLDHLVKLRASPDFAAAYGRAALVTADGWPIVWLAQRQGARPDRASGADMVLPVCAGAVAQGSSIYFVGPGPQAQTAALDILKRRFPALAVAGAETPEFPPAETAADLAAFDLDALAERINASGAALCFLSLGAPKQELLADALSRRCPKVGFLCVGAALDFISGTVQRAPLWMQRGKLEWFWRLIGDPKRLTARYARCGLLFLGLVARRP